MGQRLTIDSNIIGYWGFDEALETDVGIDETANALNLTVTASNGTTPGRVGNARKFDGTTSFATVTSALLRQTGDLTLMGWVRLSTYNGMGSQLRCLLSCAGPTTGDNELYSVSVSLSGAVVYKHDSASGPVVISTAAGTIRTNQLYFITVTRVANGLNQDVVIVVDDEPKAFSSITVNGIGQALPVPPPVANASAIFSVGRNQKETNSSFWDGFLDEVSVHDVARPHQAYILDAYYRGALRSTTTKLSATNTVVAVSSYEMGAGVRWWCYERDRDLYVVKESPFGNFGPETRLTTVGGGASTFNSAPELIYDPATDTLYVFFIGGNRIFKLTANSTDDPATINMPYTADTGSIIKSVDNVDGGRIGVGGGHREVLPNELTYITRTPVKFSTSDPDLNYLGAVGGSIQEVNLLAGTISGISDTPSVAFTTIPVLGFGILVGPVNPFMVGGYAVYRTEGGVPIQLADPVLLSYGAYFVPIATRVYGRGYFAETLNVDRHKTGQFSEVIVDLFLQPYQIGGNEIYFGQRGDGFDREGATVGSGGGQRDLLIPDISYVFRSPVKLSVADSDVNNMASAGGGQLGSITNGSTNRPVDAGKVVITG